MSAEPLAPWVTDLHDFVEQSWEEFHAAINRRNNWYRNGRDVYQFVFTICVPAFLMLFGLLGNGLSIAVLKRRKLSSATLLLITLAIVDSLLLIFGFTFEGIPQLGLSEIVYTYSQSWFHYMIAHYLIGPIVTATELFECCTMIILGVDR